MLRSVERLYAVYGEQVGADAFYAGTHTDQQAAQLLNIGLAGCIVDHGAAFGHHGGHYDIGRACDGSFRKQDVSAFKFLRSDNVGSLVRVVDGLGPQLGKSVEMGVEMPAAYLVSSRF